MKKSIGPRTLPMPAPVWLVGTYDAEGKPNLMAAAWAGICNSRPPCVTVSLRKATYSYGNTVARQAYTINVPTAAQAQIADYVGVVSGRDVDKFAQAGLTPVKSTLVDAPYAAEFPVVMECRVLHTLELGLHTQFVGEVVDIKVDEAMLGADGAPDIGKLELFVYANSTYWRVGEFLGQAHSIGRKLKPGA